MTSALGGLSFPPELASLISQMIGSRGATLDDAANEAHQSALAATAAALEAQRKLNIEQAAPAPDTAQADFLTRLTGAASDALTGGAGAGKTAEDTITQGKAAFEAKRHERLSLLAGAYEKAADRAAKLGDTEAEIKWRTKLAKVEADQKDIHEALDVQSRLKAAEVAANAQRATTAMDVQGRKDVAEINARSGEREAQINHGINPDTKERITANPKSWLTADRQREALTLLFESKNKQGKINYVSPKIAKSKLLNGAIPPEQSQTLNSYAQFIAHMRDPKSGKFLFKHTEAGALDASELESVKAVLRRYYGVTPEEANDIATWQGN